MTCQHVFLRRLTLCCHLAHCIHSSKVWSLIHRHQLLVLPNTFNSDFSSKFYFCLLKLLLNISTHAYVCTQQPHHLFYSILEFLCISTPSSRLSLHPFSIISSENCQIESTVDILELFIYLFKKTFACLFHFQIAPQR